MHIPELYLDTHVVIWLYDHGTQKLSGRAVDCLESASSLLISPMAELEIELFFEIGKITIPSGIIVHYLSKQIRLSVCSKPFSRVIAQSIDLKWTRDPFDRLITAQASLDQSPLLTKDRFIHDHYPYTIW